jgi:bisphosphoglycerate-independent phosphoglycerate mutase (AlkP superfamily)
MDRDHNWERTDLAYSAIKDRQAPQFAVPNKPLQTHIKITREMNLLSPAPLKSEMKKRPKVKSGDSVIFAIFSQ